MQDNGLLRACLADQGELVAGTFQLAVRVDESLVELQLVWLSCTRSTIHFLFQSMESSIL